MSASGGSPYARVMGADFANLQPRVRAFHQGSGIRHWAGVSAVRRGKGPLASAIATLFGFPRAGAAIPTSVTITPSSGGETWTRDFSGQILRSVQSADMRGKTPLLVERFGPVRVGSALVLDGDRLRIVPRRGTLFAVPIPARMLPAGEAFETERDGRFCFDVSILVPFVGLIVSYRGELTAAGALDRTLPSSRAMRSQGPRRP